MAKIIFVNLPVANVAASTAFYEAIGMVRDARFSNEQSSAMSWSDEIVFMILDKAFYATLSPKQIGDPRTTTTSLIALSFDSRAEVDTIVERALAAGGTEGHPAEDLGFMYSRAFEDLDGHAFGPLYMDVDAALTAMAPAAEAA